MSVVECNYTQVPNIVLDDMKSLSGSELKLIMFVCRQTFGYHRNSAKLSVSFIANGTGLSEQSVRNAAAPLINREWLEKVPDGSSYSYRLIVKPTNPSKNLPLQNLGGQNFGGEGVKILEGKGQNFGGEGVKILDPNKERSLKKDLKKLSNKENDQKSESGFAALTEPEPAIASETVSPRTSTPVNSTESAAVEDQSSAAAPPHVENSARWLSGVEKVERHYNAPQVPWGSYHRPDSAFLDYLLRFCLPKKPCNKGVDLNLGDARKWLNKAKYDEQRRDDALIEWESFQEWRSQQNAPSAAAIAEQQPQSVADSDIQAKIQTLNEWLRNGRSESVTRAIATNPQWGLALDSNGSEVVCKTAKLSA